MGLGWRKTWDDKDDDYVYCDADGEQIGRVYFGHMRDWRWFFAGATGHADSRRMAMLAVEEAYERSQITKVAAHAAFAS